MIEYSKDKAGWSKILLGLTVPEGEISGDGLIPEAVEAVMEYMNAQLKKHKISTIKEYNLYLSSGSRDVCWGVSEVSIPLPKQTFWNTVRRFLNEARAFRYANGAEYAPQIRWVVMGSDDYKFLTMSLSDCKVKAADDEEE